MRNKIIQILKFITFLALGILLLWLAFRNVHLKGLADDLKKANYLWIIASVIFGLIAYVSRARRWVLLIHPLGYKPSLLNTHNALMSGYLANLALPRLGEITRCVALGKKEKIPVDQLIGTVVVERSIDFITLLLIMLMLVFTSGSQIKDFMKKSIFDPFREKILSMFGFTWLFYAIILAICIISLFLLIRYRKNLRKIRLFAKFFDVAKGVINGLKSIATLERKWEFLFHTVFIWLNYALMTWVVAFSLPGTSGLSFYNGIFLLVVGGLAMSAPVQSGMGIFHYVVSRGIALVTGVTIEDGLSYAILTHESQLVYVLIVGTISFFLLARNNKKEEIS